MPIIDMGGRYGVAPTVPASGATTLDAANARGEALRVNLTGNATGVRIVNGAAGMRLVLLLVQDSVGSRTATWHSSVRFTGGTAPTLTTTAGHADALQLFSYDGTVWVELSRSLDVGGATVMPADA